MTQYGSLWRGKQFTFSSLSVGQIKVFDTPALYHIVTLDIGPRYWFDDIVTAVGVINTLNHFSSLEINTWVGVAQLDVTQQPLLRSISQNLITARQIVNIHVSPPSTEVLL